MGFEAFRTGLSTAFVILAPGFFALGFLLTGCVDRAGATLWPPAGPGPSGAEAPVPVSGVVPVAGVGPADEAADGPSPRQGPLLRRFPRPRVLLISGLSRRIGWSLVPGVMLPGATLPGFCSLGMRSFSLCLGSRGSLPVPGVGRLRCFSTRWCTCGGRSGWRPAGVRARTRPAAAAGF